MSGRPAQLVPVSLIVDQAAINRYAAITGDYNPIHVEPDFAAKTEMKGVIAHGTLCMNLIWQALERSLGREAVCGIDLDIRFRRPARVGDRIEAGGQWNDESNAYAVWIRNGEGTEIISGDAILKAP